VLSVQEAHPQAKWMKIWCTETCLLRTVCDLANADYVGLFFFFVGGDFAKNFNTRPEYSMNGCKMCAFSAD
jgi:hypothetical protein